MRQRRNDERASNSPIVRITHTPFLQVPFMNMSINTPVLFGSVELGRLYMYTCKLYIKCRFHFLYYFLVHVCTLIHIVVNYLLSGIRNCTKEERRREREREREREKERESKLVDMVYEMFSLHDCQLDQYSGLTR